MREKVAVIEHLQGQSQKLREAFAPVTIDRCCDILNTKRVPLNEGERFEIKGPYPYYGANGVQGFISKFIFDEDLILIAEDGGNFEQHIERPIAYRVSGKCWVNNHAHILRAKAGFDQGFIFYSLEHKNILFFIAGGTRSKLTQGELKKITIQAPASKREQIRIAEILSTADAAIAQTEALLAKYRRIRTGLLSDLLSRGIDEHGRLRNKVTHSFAVEDRVEVPKGWQLTSLGELFNEFTTGATPRRDEIKYWEEGTVNWVTSGELKYQLVLGTNEKITPIAVRETNLFLYPPGTFFIAITGLEAEGTRGSCAIIGVPATTNQSCMAFETNNKIDVRYLYYWYLLNGKYLSLKYSQGSKQQSLNGKLVQSIPIALPKTIEEQLRIVERVDTVEQLIQSETAHLSKLQSIKRGLMSDLLSGKVRVKS